MKNNDGRQEYGIFLDNMQLRANANESKNMLCGIGDTAVAESARIDNAYKKVAGAIATIGGTVALGALAKQVYDFSNAFDKSMKEVSTISDTVSKDIDGFKRQILELGTKIPIAADAAGKALYQIVSAGYDGAAGMNLLEVSAKSAIAGMTDTTTAADAITTLLNAYKKSASEASSISDQLFMTAKLGKTTFGELGQSISQAAPIAASFGIETEQVLAAVATLTKSGTPTAQAMTQIRAAIIGASKVLGDGAFQTRTFQEGLAEIAERAGGSESELRKLIPEIEATNGVLGLTGINAKMAASDLEALGEATGETEKAFTKMNDSADNQLAILKNNMLKKFHEIGQGGLNVMGGLAKALNTAFETGAIDDLIAIMGVLIATIGVYKAQLLVTNAVKLVGNNIIITEEINAYKALLPVKEAAKNQDIELMVAKGQLSEKRAEELASIRAEVQAELERLKVKEKILVAQVAEATKEDALALKQALNAERRERAARQELSQAVQSGNAQKIRRAEIKLTLAEEELNIALKNKEVTANNLATASNKAKSASTAFDTMQTKINAASSLGAAKAKNIFTAATMRLTTAFKSLKVAFMSNPIGMVITLLTTAVSAMHMFGNETEEAADHTDLLNKSIADLGIETAKETQEIDNAFAKLLKAKQGTKEYGAAKDEIISKYGKYLNGLSSEISSLSDVSAAYNAVRNAAEDSIRARFKASFTEQANSDAVKKMGEAIKNIIDNVKGGFSDEFLKQFPDQVTAINAEIVNALTNTEKTLREKKIDIGAILEDYGFSTVDATKMMRSMDFFDLGDRENFVESFEEAFQSALNIENVANEAFDSITENQVDNGKKLETVLERRKRLTKELQDATLLLGTMQSDNSTSSKTEIDAQQKKIKDLEQSLGIDRKASEKSISNQVKNSEAQIEAEQKLKQTLVDVAFETEQAVIDAKAEGFDKQMAQIELNYRKKQVAIELWEREQRKVVEEAQKATFVAKGGKESDFKVDGADVRFIPINKAYDAQSDANAAEQGDAGKRLLDDLKAQWQSWGDEYQQIEDKITAIKQKAENDRQAIVQAHKAGKITATDAATTTATIDKGEQSQTDDLNSQKTKLTASWKQVFCDLKGMSRKEVDKLIDAINAELKNKKLAPADASALLEQLKKAKEYSVGLNPFAAWVDSLGDVKTATEAVETARQKVAKTNLTGSEKEKVEAAQALQEAQKLLASEKERRAASASKSLGDIAAIAGATSDLLKTFGIESPAVDGVVSALGSLASIDFTNPISVVTGGLKAITSLIAGIFGESDKKKEKEIAALQASVDALEKSYEELGEAIDKAYSSSAAKLIAQSNDMLKQQNEQIAKQKELEQSKKNPDTGAIEAYDKAIEDNLKKIEQNKQAAVDAIFGADLQSAIDDFASAYMDAWAAGEDRAQSQKDVVKNMIRGIIQEMLKSDIKGQVEKMRAQIEGFMADDVLSDWELTEIGNMGDEVGRIMEERGKIYDKILKDDKNNADSLTGQIRGTVATEQSVAELGGIFRGQWDTLKRIEAGVDFGFKEIANMARTSLEIAANTLRAANNTDGLTAKIDATNSKLDQIITNTKADNGTI